MRCIVHNISNQSNPFEENKTKTKSKVLSNQFSQETDPCLLVKTRASYSFEYEKC